MAPLPRLHASRPACSLTSRSSSSVAALTNTDMRTARGAGMYAVGVLWGFRESDELVAAGAQTLVARPEEILKW